MTKVKAVPLYEKLVVDTPPTVTVGFVFGTKNIVNFNVVPSPPLV